MLPSTFNEAQLDDYKKKETTRWEYWAAQRSLFARAQANYTLQKKMNEKKKCVEI